jgi:DNA repair exonuclease SbcCD nuclease subunit
MFRFIHCADLHLGSAFAAWRKVRPDEARELALAPFAAFDRIAELAIEDSVRFVVLAGDVFDSTAPTLYAETRFRRTLEKLDGAGIRVFWATGNHDWAVNFEDLPANTVRFAADKAECFGVSDADGRVLASVAGISHAAAGVKSDLAPQLDAALRSASGFRVAVLHANVDGDPGYEPYAPAPLAELAKGSADYWALGHIHGRKILHERPFVVYSGSPQGRSVNEPGARGAVLVEVDDAGRPSLENIDVQLFRFETLTLDRLDGAADLSALRTELASRLPDIAEPLYLRLILAGPSPLNARLRAAEGPALEEIFAAELKRKLPRAALESVIVNTTGLHSASRREGLAAEVAAVRDEVDPARELETLPLSPAEFSGFSSDELAEIAREAEELLLDYLSGDLEAGK